MKKKKLSKAEKCELLLNRIKENYLDYCNSMMALDKSEIIAKALEIALTSEAYKYMVNGCYMSDPDFFLKFYNPLEVVTYYFSGEIELGAFEGILDDCIEEILDTQDALMDFQLINPHDKR